jgi:3-keto-disaccharide hydrolase
MRVLISALCVLVLVAMTSAFGANEADRKEWVPIFNGKNLDGWVVKVAHHEVGDNYRDTFRVEDGVLRVSYDKYQEFGGRFAHVYYREKLSHYVLSLEYRFVGEMMKDAPDYVRLNSGVMIHSQAPDTILKDQNFPISVEAQFLGEAAGTIALRPTMNVCTPATEISMGGKRVEAHCTNSTSRTYRGDQWVRVEVEVLGNERVRHLVDGQTVLEYEKPEIGGGVVTGFDPAVKKDGTPLHEGYIALQAEGQPVEFRKVQLLNLSGCMDPQAPNFKSYYVHRDDSKCAARKAR